MPKQESSLPNLASIINYNNIEVLENFITIQKKILPRSLTNLKSQQHRKLAKAIKKARCLSLFSSPKRD